MVSMEWYMSTPNIKNGLATKLETVKIFIIKWRTVLLANPKMALQRYVEQYSQVKEYLLVYLQQFTTLKPN